MLRVPKIHQIADEKDRFILIMETSNRRIYRVDVSVTKCDDALLYAAAMEAGWKEMGRRVRSNDTVHEGSGFDCSTPHFKIA
jgi:hypothetical protein